MSNSMDVREHAMEEGFQNQNLVHFKVIARRNKLFGIWAGELMSLNQEDLKKYVKKLVEDACNFSGDAVLLKRVRLDLKKEGVNISEFKLKKRLEYCSDDAFSQIKKGV